MAKTQFKKENLSPHFCPVPWMHTHITPQSERRLCCSSQEQARWQVRSMDRQVIPIASEYSPLTLEEHWNSDKMKDIRLRMLTGKDVPECNVCNNKLANIHTYRQYFLDDLFKDSISTILENTDETGFTTLKPVSFDYRVSNLCNFKCRMCSEQSSSSWESEKKIHKIVHKREAWSLEENKQKIENFQQNVVEEELWAAAKEGRLEEIYWVGGEPLMYKIHWELMEYLVKTDQAKNIVVRYNTNLSRISWKGTNLVDLLPHFKRVTLQASMDGTGDIAEYVRTGLDWEEWLTNLKECLKLRDKLGMNSVVLDVTITMPGLFSMKSLMDLAVELNIQSYVKTCFSSNAAATLSPMILPRHLLEEVLDDLIEYEASLGSDLTTIFSDTFKNMKTRKTFDEAYPDQFENLMRGIRYQRKIEEIRPNTKTSMEKILSVNPAVLEWWKSKQ